MNPAEYSKLHEAEHQHWWYKAIHGMLGKLVDNIRQKSHITKVLDIGCGTGRWASILRSKGLEIYGIDISSNALSLSSEKDLDGLCRCSADNIGLAENCFDLITCIDILESDNIDPHDVISECYRLLKPNGYCLALSPAFQFLFSEHDRAVHGARRFSKKQMADYFKQKDFHVVLTRYYFSFLFPAMALYKLLHPPRYRIARSKAHSNLFIPSFPLNALLYAVCKVELNLSCQIRLPFGTSVYVLAQKRS